MEPPELCALAFVGHRAFDSSVCLITGREKTSQAHAHSERKSQVLWTAPEQEKLMGDKDTLKPCPLLYGKIVGDFLPRLACLWLRLCVPPDMSYCAPACPRMCVVIYL